ncbi:MAG: nucleotidyltransferase family protein [Thermoanaerobaculia bacterium]|nr:nucleotidyltransferase family protein [Thermoanaerobaculia bacterium]
MERNAVLEILERHREDLGRFGVKSLRLFGSVARDEAGEESDVDLLVGYAVSPTFSAFMDLRFYLEDLLQARVDLVTETGLRERVRPSVEKDAIRVAWSHEA